MAYDPPVAFVAGAVLFASHLEQLRLSINADAVGVAIVSNDIGALFYGRPASGNNPNRIIVRALREGQVLQAGSSFPTYREPVATRVGLSPTNTNRDSHLVTWQTIREAYDGVV